MPRVVVPLAEGFEEIEVMSIVDVLRRGGVEVILAGLKAGAARGSRGVRVEPDTLIDAVETDSLDAVVLPGGSAGAAALRDDERVQRLLKEHAKKGRLVGAICAAPIALERAGLLAGRRATSYPGVELPSALRSEESVVEDENLVTSRGPGTAIAFALKLVERLVGPAQASEVRRALLA